MTTLNPWQRAEALADVPAIEDAIRTLLADQTADNAAGLIAAVLEAAAPTPEPQPATVKQSLTDQPADHVADASKMVEPTKLVPCELPQWAGQWMAEDGRRFVLDAQPAAQAVAPDLFAELRAWATTMNRTVTPDMLELVGWLSAAAPVAPQVAPVLARDAAEVLGVSVAHINSALIAAGCAPRSTNMEISGEELLAVAAAVKAAAPVAQPLGYLAPGQVRNLRDGAVGSVTLLESPDDFATVPVYAAPVAQPLTSDKDRPGATYVNGYGYVDTAAVRAIEAIHFGAKRVAQPLTPLTEDQAAAIFKAWRSGPLWLHMARGTEAHHGISTSKGGANG